MKADAVSKDSQRSSGRFGRISAALLSQPVRLCIERAVLVTEYFRKYDDPSEPMAVRKAKTLRHLLSNESTVIFEDEIIRRTRIELQ